MIKYDILKNNDIDRFCVKFAYILFYIFSLNKYLSMINPSSLKTHSYDIFNLKFENLLFP